MLWSRVCFQSSIEHLQKFYTAQTARFHMNPDYGNVLEGPSFRDFFVRDGLYMFGKARKCNRTL